MASLGFPMSRKTSPAWTKFKAHSIGFFHIDIAEVQTGDGKLYLFVVIDRISKFAIARLAHTADRQNATTFLETVIEVVPYRIHTVPTDNGIQFCHPPRCRSGLQQSSAYTCSTGSAGSTASSTA